MLILVKWQGNYNERNSFVSDNIIMQLLSWPVVLIVRFIKEFEFIPFIYDFFLLLLMLWNGEMKMDDNEFY